MAPGRSRFRLQGPREGGEGSPGLEPGRPHRWLPSISPSPSSGEGLGLAEPSSRNTAGGKEQGEHSGLPCSLIFHSTFCWVLRHETVLRGAGEKAGVVPPRRNGMSCLLCPVSAPIGQMGGSPANVARAGGSGACTDVAYPSAAVLIRLEN